MVKKHNLKCFGGLSWLTVTEVPFTKTKFGKGVSAEVLKKIEEMVSIYIVAKRVPICGAEVEFLRKSFGYSLGRMGAEIGFSSTSILKWERAKKKRLEKVNEIGVRAWAADKLKLEISGRFSKLIGISEEQVPIILNAA